MSEATKKIKNIFNSKSSFKKSSCLTLKSSKKEGFIAHPIKRKHYTLKELLQGATSKNLKALNKETEWSRGGKSIGCELTQPQSDT